MAVVISENGGQGGRNGPKKLLRMLRDTDVGIKIVIGLTAASLLAGGTFLFLGLRDYQSMRNARSEWTQIADIAYGGAGPDVQMQEKGLIEVPVGFDSESGSNFEAISNQAVYQVYDVLYKAIDLPALQALNPNVSGYIYIPGCMIDYPILKELSPGEYFYINHNLYNRLDKYGSVFELCDSERGENSPITWIFGHHMSSGSMFSGLYNFLESDFAATPVYIYRDGYRSEYRAFGACVVDMDDMIYAFGEYEAGSELYADLLSRMSELNQLPDTGIAWPGPDDDIVILSTCYGGAGTRNRLVVLLTETRRAVTQEYYDQLQDVYQYGGDDTPIYSSDLPDGAYHVDSDRDLTGFEALYWDGLNGGSGSGSDSNSRNESSGSNTGTSGPGVEG